MITTTRPTTRSLGRLLGARINCDTPSCRRSTYVYPSTEEEALECSTGSVPGPWVTRVLQRRKWSVHNTVGTYCPEHTIVIDDDSEIDDRTKSERMIDAHADRKKRLREKADKAAARRARAAERTKHYLDKKRGNK
ncbi:hypothetical protein SEA_SKYSAND_2 [Gordonia phage Skysand]|uniref:Uncharacterized protein n=1 Tax=Gordonia phage Skysand TaxID=2301559 RepID=A0A385DRI9_9CAUD|nr:hypothetical protein KNU08_gp02 [Gordonia phage Skysand]AXQ62036.1 hypothetical protein SEA_SKYSAND_2 [Gordonia phage Skysand]